LYKGNRQKKGGFLNYIPDELRHAMRQWTTGVSIVCSQQGDFVHGMTVNSFTSVSLEPPVISVTLANNTRTFNLVQESGKFSVSLLNIHHREISDRFSGKIANESDRFNGLDVFKLPGGQIALKNALAWLECSVRLKIPFENSTLFLADVNYAGVGDEEKPLVYHNREYYSL
jgi:3-hydroxy-9,10-secoandrosta-1,3,5(10)-triene-9,17-dione monooxygenase reductase component